MAGNMESMLLGNDSSSDESDNETLEEVAAGTIPAAASIAATVKPQQPPAAPVATAPAPVTTAPANMSQSELSNRLKSLYSPANKQAQQQATQGAPSRPVQAQQPQQQQQQQQQQQMPSPVMQKMQRRDAMPPKILQQHQSQPIQHQQQPSLQAPPPRSDMPPSQSVRQSQASSAASGFRPLVPNRPSTSSAPSTSTQPSATSTTTAAADPFEPTPLRAMIQRQQQKAAAQQQVASPQAMAVPRGGSSDVGMPSQQKPLVPNVSGASSTTSSSSNPVTAAARAKMERDAKGRKEKFLMFTRVLMKYLEQKDADMHTKAKAVIRECAERNKKKEAGYESVTSSMQTRLRALVGDAYWKRAESYLNHFMIQKQKAEEKKKQEALERQQRDKELARQKIEEIEREQQAKKALLLQQQQQAKEAERMRMKEAEAKRMAAQQQQNKMQEIQRANAAKMAALKAETAIKKKTAHKRKGSAGSTASMAVAAAASRSTTPMPTERAPPREYSDLMELVDHAVDYNWTTSALLLGKDAKADVNVTEEQKRLLYGEKATPPLVAQASSAATPASIKGWSKRNVLSARAAWAKIRLREQKLAVEGAQADKNVPVVAGLTLPTSPQEKAPAPTVSSETAWFNDEKAEEDKTLALLSEATNIYLKSILEKALIAARQRENLDGIRLWHLQHGPTKPPMSIRLGCDVSRQVAQASGNAAKTVQRMEEALERHPSKARDLGNDETLYEASSMADLALLPQLANAAEQADLDAKRSFEVYGGKHSGAPPFGRVPKRPKIMLRDFGLAREWADYGHQRMGIATPHIL